MGNPKFDNQGSGDPSLNPQPPVYGLLQADFVYQENVDGAGGFPLNLDYFIPVNCQRVITARLSFRRRAYRTYSTLSNLVTGAESGHTHSHSHTSAAHTHTSHLDNGNNAQGVSYGGGSYLAVGTSGPTDIADVNSTTPGSTGTNAAGSSGHTHTVSGTSSLGVVEGAVATSITVSFDGVSHTADIIPPGPYSTDQVELDVTKFISTVVDRSWHVVSLQPSGLGRIQAVLRILYNSNQV